MAGWFGQERWCRGIGGLGVLVALAALWAGWNRVHRVHDPAITDFGEDEPVMVSEWALNANATFSGIESAPERDRLVFTFDREEPREKSACPT